MDDKESKIVVDYTMNEKFIEIINNIMKHQMEDLVNIISVKENICKRSLIKTLNEFNQENNYDF